MGTNYYLYGVPCPCCGNRPPPYHIGKSSAGWYFTLHIDPAKGISGLDDIMALCEKPGALIRDEYGDAVPLSKLRSIITDRMWKTSPSSDIFLPQNKAEIGVNGLVRMLVDGQFCIGHGPGTWSLCLGEFS